MKKLGKFEIIARVGRGAMGVVYKARDPLIDRVVALKTLNANLSSDPLYLKRFYTEARAAGNLRHPNIITVYELGHEGNVPFIAMQFFTGESLDKIIDRTPNLPLSQKVGFILYVCRALEYAHKQDPPVIHRDIKPANVMVGPDGSVAVVDFGIARLDESTASRSGGMLMGTLGYMAPELFRGGTADARSDIWATGVMFYEVLAYRKPFKGENARALMSTIVLEEPRSIQEAAPGTPDEVKNIIGRMLTKDVNARYQTMDEVLADLEPVRKRLLHADIAVLMENSRKLYQEGDLLAAKSEIVQILAWDSTNTQAMAFSEKISAQVRRQPSGPQLKARVEMARRMLVEGHPEEAKTEALEALNLDAACAPAREILTQVETVLTSVKAPADNPPVVDSGNVATRDASEPSPVQRASRDTLLPADRELALREQRKRRKNETLQMARRLLDEGKLDDSSSLLKDALDSQLLATGDPEVDTLLAKIASRKPPQTAPVATITSSPPAAGTITSSPPPAPPPNEAAYVGFKGEPTQGFTYPSPALVSEPPAAAERNASAAAVGASAQEMTVRPIHPPPSATPANSGTSPAASTGSVSQVEQEPSRLDSTASVPASEATGTGEPTTFVPLKWLEDQTQFLASVEKHLAEFLGPIAGMATRRAAAKAKDPDELFAFLASTVPSEPDRQRFLARKGELLRRLSSVPPATQSRLPRPSVAEPVPAASDSVIEVTPEAVRRASRLLAWYVGPISRILAERAAKRASSLRVLYLLLAEHLRNGERARFLSEAGFPEESGTNSSMHF
jgi:serine/threonine protein kinase